MVYQKVDTNLDFVAHEKEVKNFWTKNKIAKKAVDQREGCKDFTFYDGPPTANGQPHIGHVLTRVIKDLFPRYHSMKGKKVLRKAGWDTHGLPVELEVEKLIGINGKEQIENYGIEPFIKKCRESVWKYKGMWEEFSGVVGYWADMNSPYITYENNYIESEWWALKQIWNKGLLYKGYKVVPYCPRCGTSLSSHEVALNYKNVKDRSAIVKFKAVDDDAYYLAWTTTPWTLPSNLTLCVNPKVDYVKIEVKGIKYILTEALVEKIFTDSDDERKILARYKGQGLEYKKYEPLWSFADNIITESNKKAFFITCDDYVTTEDGTGIVHCAPAFGEDDYRVCKKYDTPLVQFVDSKGNMTKETYWAGIFVKNADPLILEDLKKSEKLFKAPIFEHSYLHCWRCDTPLIYYARESWFIKTTAVKDELIKNNAKINWIPPNIGTGRFGDWLEHVQDWGISRNRYWGTPLNVWECSCGHQHSIGSSEELKLLSKNCPDNIELHRPYIDNVTITCEKCGKEMYRVTEVIDCWFDSGAMPFAQWHYPFENKNIFEDHFPADFISEAVDQTRGWFYSLLVISTILFNSEPFKNCIVLGHVLDKNGQKMSKSKGNAINPMEALKTYGADTIRWYFYENNMPWFSKKYSDKTVIKSQHKFLGTLWNTYAFFVLYANIDDFNAIKYTLNYDKLNILDKWCLSCLHSTIKAVDEYLALYNVNEAAKILQDFIDKLSNWYVRRSRERFWTKGLTQDKINAYMTLYTSLVAFVKLAAPMIPFITENIYNNLVLSIDKQAPISVHLCDYPVANTELINTELEKQMNSVIDIVQLGRSTRNLANIKIRQPIASMLIKADKLPTEFISLIQDELNVKSVKFCTDMDEVTSYSIKLNFRVIGKKYYNYVQQIKEALAMIDSNIVKASLDKTNKFILTLNDKTIELTSEDLLIETKNKDNYIIQSNNNIQVAISTELTSELINEGLIRETISKIQTIRRNNDLQVIDRINLFITADDEFNNIVKNNMQEIKEKVLADNIIFQLHETAEIWDINGIKVSIAIEVI